MIVFENDINSVVIMKLYKAENTYLQVISQHFISQFKIKNIIT